jgi:pilus assembly protein CpaE
MMPPTIKTLVALDSGASRETVEALLPYDTSFQLAGIVEGLDEAWKTLQETHIDLLLVVAGGDAERVLVFIDGAVRQRPDRPVVVLAPPGVNGLVRRVFEAGADDIVTLPENGEHIRFVLEKAVARKQGAAVASGVAASPMICVLGPKGGTGKTLTTANLAVAFAEQGRSVAVVDLDLQFGDLALALGLMPERTIYDLAKAGGSIDAAKLDAYLATHESGVRVLIAPVRPDQAGVVEIPLLREIYAGLRATADVVIVDTPPGFTPEVIASIDTSTHVCMVGMLDALSLKNSKLGLETLELMGYKDDRIRVVLNRADSRVGITTDDACAILGRKPDILVPSDREIPRAVNEGTPIVLAKPASEAAQAFTRLAAMYLEPTEARPPAPAATNGHHEPGRATRALAPLLRGSDKGTTGWRRGLFGKGRA